MSTSESNDSSCSGSEYSSGSSSGSEYTDGSSDETDSEDSEENSPVSDIGKSTSLKRTPDSSKGDIPPWQADIDIDQQNKTCSTPPKSTETQQKLPVPKNTGSTKSSSEREADRDIPESVGSVVKDKRRDKSVSFEDEKCSTTWESIAAASPPISTITISVPVTKSSVPVATTLLPVASASASVTGISVSIATILSGQPTVSVTSSVANSTKSDTSSLITADKEVADTELGAKTIETFKNIAKDSTTVKNNTAQDLVQRCYPRRAVKHRLITQERLQNTNKDIVGEVDEYITEDQAPGDDDAPGVNDAPAEEFCFCRGEESGVMVQCEKCSEWYHDECLQLTEQEVFEIETFYCTVCISSSYSGLVTVYKSEKMSAKRTERQEVKQVDACDPANKEVTQQSNQAETYGVPNINHIKQGSNSDKHQTDNDSEPLKDAAKEADEDKSSDEEWVDIATDKEPHTKSPQSEPCVNFITKTKEMLAKKPLEPDKSELVLPVTCPMDLKRNEFWDENFYKPHINEDLSSCFSQMSIDWESARKIFASQNTVSPLKNVELDGIRPTNETPCPKTPLKGSNSVLNTPRKLSLSEVKTPTRRPIVPSPADPEVMRIFEKSLLVSPCKQFVRRKDRPSRRISLIKLHEQVTMDFGKSPSPVTAREMGMKLFSGKHDWNSHSSNEKENTTPDTPTKSQKIKPARKPLFNDKPLDPFWAKGLDEINSDYPFYTLNKNQAVEEVKENTPIIVVGANLTTHLIETSLEAEMDQTNPTKDIVTTPQKSKMDDSHLFKTPTKSVRKMRKKSVSSDRQSEGWSPGAKLLEHSCPYDPTESGCYSQTVEPQTPLNVPLAPSLDSIISCKFEPDRSPKQEDGAKNITPETKKIISSDSVSIDLSRSFELEFEYDVAPIKSNWEPRITSNQGNITVKSLLPKLLSHLEAAAPEPAPKSTAEVSLSSEKIEDSPTLVEKSGNIWSIASPNRTDVTNDVVTNEAESPSKCMKDVPSFIEAPVEDTLDFEENVTSPATSTTNVLIGYGKEFCDEGEVFSSDDEEHIYGDIREAQRNALCDSSEASNSGKANSSSNHEKEEIQAVNLDLSVLGSVKKKVHFENTEAKLLTDKEFLEKSKAMYDCEKSAATEEPKGMGSHIEEKSKPEMSNSATAGSLPFTFKPIQGASFLDQPEDQQNVSLKKLIIVTPKKAIVERCDTPLSALFPEHDEIENTDKTGSFQFQTSSSAILSNASGTTTPSANVDLEMIEGNGGGDTANTVPACDKPRVEDSDIHNILASCETLSNPSFADRSLHAFKNTPVAKSSGNEDTSSPSVATPQLTREDKLAELKKSLSSEERLLDLTPPGPIESVLVNKTPLSAAIVLMSAEDEHSNVEQRLHPIESHPEPKAQEPARLIDAIPSDNIPAVNFMLSSEETMSNWTPEPTPSPTEAPTSDPLLGPVAIISTAKRRISLHDYVIRKEAISNTPTLPESSFSTPEFAKSKSINSIQMFERAQSPLAVEHDIDTPQNRTNSYECTQSPIPMEHETPPEATPGGVSTKRWEMVAKLKYHHLIPIHVPPREFLYCRRVKVIQDMLINELIGGVDFKNHQLITEPLYTTRSGSTESANFHGRARTRSEVVTRKESTEGDIEKRDDSSSSVPLSLSVVRQQSAPILSSRPSISTRTDSSEVANLRQGQSTTQNPNRPQQNVSLKPTTPETRILSGMGDPSLYDEESHDYFKNVKIPKVKRVTDTFMSDSSLLNTYDCGPDTIAIGKIIQQSIASDASSVSLDSLNKTNLSLDGSRAANTRMSMINTPNLGAAIPAAETSVAPTLSSTPKSKLTQRSANMETVNEYVKQCLFSDEGISRSPLLGSSSEQILEEVSRSSYCVGDEQTGRQDDSVAQSTPTRNTPYSVLAKAPLSTPARNEHLTSATSKEYTPTKTERYVQDECDQSPCIYSVQSPPVVPFCTVPKEEATEEPKQRPPLPQTQTEVSTQQAVRKPPKFKIPKKNKANTAIECTSQDPMITSPSKIKQFISSTASVEHPSTSTLFTQRKKKQLDVIISKERAQREQVLQEYLGTREENSLQPSCQVEETSVHEKRKRRKTNSPEPSKSFDLRQVLCRGSSTKPECKRAKRRSSESHRVSGNERRTLDKKHDDNDQRAPDRSSKKTSRDRRLEDPQLDFKDKLFDALAVINTKERSLHLPDKMAGRHTSLTAWLDSWKDAEVRLKELRTSRLQIRDPNYQPRDLSKLKLSEVSQKCQLRPRPAKQTRPQVRTGLSKKVTRPLRQSVFGWKSSKPDSCHVNLFPAQAPSLNNAATDTSPQITSSNPQITSSNPLIKTQNPLLKLTNPLLKNKRDSNSKIQAPQIWTECMKNADEAHRHHKQMRKNTVLDIMTTKELGPLSTLQRALTTNVKVTVVTRTFKGVRGECTGYVVAYDRFMNLALSDVTEHYRSVYHKPHDSTPSTQPTLESHDKLQHDPNFVNFRRSVSLDPELLRGIRSPSQSPERDHDDNVDKGGVSGSPGGSIRSPSLSPPPSEQSTPVKISATPAKMKSNSPPGLLGWAYHTPEYRKFKYTNNNIKSRHCKQVFVRGDNIVLIRLVE